jgi:hypothetical protein
VRLKVNREHDALRDLNWAIELNPKKALYNNARLSIREGLNDLRGALADVNAGLEVDPADPFCRANQAWDLHRLGHAAPAPRGTPWPAAGRSRAPCMRDDGPGL